jgi:cell shape-determining protein MreC
MWLGATGVFLLSLLTVIADRAGALNAVRPMLHDMLSPGRLVVLSLQAGKSPAVLESRTDGTDIDAARIRQNQERLLRQLMIENARLRHDLKQEKKSSSVLQTMEPLMSLAQFDVVQAHVVSASGLPNSLRDLIVDAGKSAGITRSELVIDGTGAILSAGSDDSVAAGDRVLTGAVVVGRIEKTARWVSLVQPVTATGFKAQVTLMRQTPEGLHPGPAAMLEGSGTDECLLTGIPHTEAVAVGDEVVSADVNGVRGPPLYFGRVTRAEFLAGGQWDVRVQPAALMEDLETVGILRLRLASELSLASESLKDPPVPTP